MSASVIPFPGRVHYLCLIETSTKPKDKSKRKFVEISVVEGIKPSQYFKMLFIFGMINDECVEVAEWVVTPTP